MTYALGDEFDYFGADIEQFCRVDVGSVGGSFVGFEIRPDFIQFEREFDESVVAFCSREFEESVYVFEGNED